MSGDSPDLVAALAAPFAALLKGLNEATETMTVQSAYGWVWQGEPYRARAVLVSLSPAALVQVAAAGRELARMATEVASAQSDPAP